MSEEKRMGSELSSSAKDGDDKLKPSGGSRARNRTVMLTPEMTGQVRAMLYQEPEEKPDPMNDVIDTSDWSRPEATGEVSIQDIDRSASSDYGRDFSAGQPPERRERGNPTGRVDLELRGEMVQNSPLESVTRNIGHDSYSSLSAPVSRPPISGVQGAATPGVGVRRGTAAPASNVGAPARIAAPAPTSKIVGFLISFDKSEHGEVHEIRAGRWLITSRATDHGEYILIQDESISPLHAIVRATKEGKVQILDQLSEFGTGVRRVGAAEEEEVAGAMVGVDHGDILRLGQRNFTVCLVPKAAEPSAEVQE